jgi:predicted Rossmann-fold nucleotide-binding protein
MVRPQSRGFLLKERVMSKTRKFRLVRLGDAKVLTRGEVGSGDELVTMHLPQP